jgi:hypothetical protein
LQVQVLLVDVSRFVWLIHQLFHFHQFPCVQTLMSVSPRIESSPRLILNLSGSFKGPWCLIHQLFHFHQFPSVQAPILVGSNYVLPLSPRIDGSPRLIWNLSGRFQGSWWLPDHQKEYRSFYLCNPILYSPLCKPWWHLFQPGILLCGCQDWSFVPFSSSIYTPQQQCLYCFWTCLGTRLGPFCCLGWTHSAIHICQETWPWMACRMHTLEASCHTPDWLILHILRFFWCG